MILQSSHIQHSGNDQFLLELLCLLLIHFVGCLSTWLALPSHSFRIWTVCPKNL